MMVVVPHLSENLELFGIYSVCLSISVYLSYSDLGFISAGQKFAAEAYKRNESLNELAITGFFHFYSNFNVPSILNLIDIFG